MHKKTSARIKWFIAIQLATLSTPALSQNKAQNDRQNKFLVEEIVVTARKREESVNDVPLSISAYSAQELKYRQIDSTDQLTSVTPNLQFSSHAPSSGHNSAAVVFIRGVGQPDFLPSSDPGVGLYIDGVYVARSVGAVDCSTWSELKYFVAPRELSLAATLSVARCLYTLRGPATH